MTNLSPDDLSVVHPELVDFLIALRQVPPRDLSMTPAQIRAENAAQADLSAMLVEDVEIDRVVDVEIPVTDGTIGARIYHPVAGDNRPTHVYFHGGGFIMGSVDSSDRSTRMIAARTGLSIVSVDYRLAPEFRWPTAPDDCYAATCWVAEHADEYGLDATAMSVGGESAGGNLAAVVALMCRDRGGPELLAQWLSIPVFDMTMPESPSLERFGKGFGLDYDEIVYCGDHFIAEADRAHPYASPVFADLAGLPPAVVVVGECDPLYDQGRRYAALLAEAGVPVTEIVCTGHGHGSMFFTGMLESARTHVADMVTAIHTARAR